MPKNREKGPQKLLLMALIKLGATIKSNVIFSPEIEKINVHKSSDLDE